MIHKIFVFKVVAVADADAIIAKGAALISAHNWKPYMVKPVTVKLADMRLSAHFRTWSDARGAFGIEAHDGRNGAAHLLFHEQQKHRDASVQKSLNCNLAVPTARNAAHVSDLDRIVMDCFVTQDLTIRIEAHSSSQGEKRSVEIQDLCYGLEVS